MFYGVCKEEVDQIICLDDKLESYDEALKLAEKYSEEDEVFITLYFTHENDSRIPEGECRAVVDYDLNCRHISVNEEFFDNFKLNK